MPAVCTAKRSTSGQYQDMHKHKLVRVINICTLNVSKQLKRQVSDQQTTVAVVIRSSYEVQGEKIRHCILMYLHQR